LFEIFVTVSETVIWQCSVGLIVTNSSQHVKHFWLFSRCRKLKYLDVIGLHKLTGNCLQRVPESVPQLTFLDLRQCNSVGGFYCIIFLSYLWCTVLLHFD